MGERSNFRALLASAFLLALGSSLYQGVSGKFAVEAFDLSAREYGMVDAVRELPGLFLFLLMAVFARLSLKGSWIVAGGSAAAGCLLLAAADSFAGLLAATLVLNIGLHVGYVVGDAWVLEKVPEGKRAHRMGQMASAEAVAGLLTTGGIWWIGSAWEWSVWLILAFVLTAGGTALGWLLPGKSWESAPRLPLVFRFRYRSFYAVSLLSAGREMITLTFAVFLLVKELDTPLSTMGALFAANHLIAFITRPWIGRWIDRWGEERSLAVNYVLVGLIFLGYAWIRDPWILYVLFVLDHVLAGFDDIAVTTYAGRMVSRDDLSATLAMGSTLAYGFAVLIPVAGGWLWTSLGSVAPFLLGAGLCGAAAIFSGRLVVGDGSRRMGE